jgi:hypothetical protein
MLKKLLQTATLATLVIAIPFAIKADVEDCREAIRAFKSAGSDIADAFRTYGQCVSNSDR